MKQHPHRMLITDFSRQQNLRRGWPGRVRLAGLGLVGLLLLACNLFQTGRPTSSAAPLEISYVTATPGSAMALSEGQRFQGLPPMNPAPQPLPGPYFAGANEMGKVIVLEYHRIGYPEQRYQRTPAHLRADLERLYQNGYYPVNFIEIIRGLPEVPPGKKPIALTFDDSDISQFRVLDDLTIDGDSAVGILLNFHKQHPEEWPMRATFFVLGNDNGNHYSLFGQSDLAREKMQVLVDLGMEIGSHTVSHADLSVATAERIYWELAVSQHVIEELVPGYKVQSLSMPFGGFPFTLDFLKSGQWGDMSYSYAGNAAAWGGPTVSPFDSTFEPYHVSRLEVTATSLDYWLTYFEQNPHAYYISDGDPNRLTFPQELQVSTEK